MTREEAIKELSVEYLGDSERMIKAKKMAIKALEQEPTTKNDIRACKSCVHSKDGKCAGTEKCHLCMWKNQYTPTTKNNLGVDCISRQSVLDAIDSKAWEFCDYLISKGRNDEQKPVSHFADNLRECVREEMPSVTPQEPRWIPVSERLPETDNKNSINNYNVLLWVKDKNDPEDEPQIYLGKLKKVNGDDGSHNFWGIKTEPCDWTIWGWSYFHEPEVISWMPLPQPYKPQESEK